MTLEAGLTLDEADYFERLAEIEARHWWSVSMWRLAAYWLDRAIAGRRDLEALDVGCGIGATTARLAARADVARVIGLEPSPDARARAALQGFPVVAGSSVELPFATSSFDLVTCFDVLQHVGPGRDLAALREIARVLRPGGIALIRSNGGGWSDTPIGKGDVHIYRLGDLKTRVGACGLDVERATHANCCPSLGQELLGRLVWPLRGERGILPHPSLGGLRIRMPSAAKNRIMGGVSGIETYLAGRLGVVWPFGHSTMILGRKRSC